MNKITDKPRQVPVLTAIALFFILGILIGNYLNIPFFIGLGLAASAIPAAFLARKKDAGFYFIFLALCLVLGISHARNYLRLPDNHISSLKNINQLQPLKILGIVDSDPIYRKQKTSFIFKVKKIILNPGDYQMQGNILVNVFSGEGLVYGQELILEGTLHRPFNFGAAGSSFNYRDYLKNQGIYSILEVAKGKEILFLRNNQGNFLASLSFRLKRRLRSIFAQYLWPANSAVLAGITLGDRQGLPEEIRQAFVRTGTAHIIAISGFNVGIVVFTALFILKALGIKRKPRFILAIPLLIIHCLAVGAGASVVRATLMAIVLLMAYLLDRESEIINSLSLSALIILGYNPLGIFDVGFQLSFISVLGIVLLSPRIMAFKIKPKANVLLRFIWDSLAVSLAAWLSTVGFIAYYFRIVTPIALLANLIVVPLTSLIIVLGFTLGLAAIFFPLIAMPIAASANFLMALLFKVAFWLGAWPFAYFYI